MTRSALVVALCITAVASPAGAQTRWKEIGKTSSGNSVYVDPRSVKRSGGIVTATVRVRFTTPVETAKGKMTASRTIAMFDCARRKLAAKENVYYLDERTNRVAERTVNRQPGYGTALKGTLGDVALTYFCDGAGRAAK